MRKMIAILVTLTFLSACEKKPFRGFLVCKEYIPAHMSDEREQVVQEAYVTVPVVPPRRHEPEYIQSAWIFYVANKNYVGKFNVDSLTYIRHKVGERIVMR